MKFTLTDSEFDFITINIINKFHLINTEVFIFGSRAKNSHNKYSDLDLLLKLKSDNLDEVKKLKSELDEFLVESNFPYKVDIVLESELASSYREDVLASAVSWNEP